MSIEQWWPRLQPSTRDWLIANNGDAVPGEILDEVVATSGPISSDSWWVGQNDSTGFHFSDAGSDWIEAVANGEDPVAPSSPD
jgi:hypothetical protein